MMSSGTSFVVEANMASIFDENCFLVSEIGFINLPLKGFVAGQLNCLQRMN